MKTATFTVRGSEEQSRRWKMAAEGEGYASAGVWLAYAADAYLKVRARAGRPMPLAWHRSAFRVVLEGGEVQVRGQVSPPFATFRGTAEGPTGRGTHRHTLVHLPTGRIIATLRSIRQCKALGSELAPVFVRDEQAGASIVERHAREQA